MKKTTLLFQIVTEGLLLGFFAVCLSPTTFNFELNFLGQTLSLDVSGLVALSESTIAVLEAATMLILFLTIIFSMPIREEPPHIRQLREYVRKAKREKRKPKVYVITPESLYH